MNVLRHFSSTYRLYKNQKEKNRIKAKQKNDNKSALHRKQNKKKRKNVYWKVVWLDVGPIVYVVPRDSLI